MQKNKKRIIPIGFSTSARDVKRGAKSIVHFGQGLGGLKGYKIYEKGDGVIMSRINVSEYNPVIISIHLYGGNAVTGEKIMTESIQETKICSRCGKELPIEDFRLYYNKYGGKKIYRSECKACEAKYYKNYILKQREKRAVFSDNIEMLFQRKYKTIDPRRILDISDLPVIPLGTDEIFVKLMDYKDTWLSNYGRIIRRTYGNYSLLNGTLYKKGGGLGYTLPKNVFIDGKWVFKQIHVYAPQLVIETFIVNNDKINNNFIWHSGYNKEDNYYRNLYPLTEKQYYTVREHFKETGDDSEEYILNVMNDIRFKEDDWCVKYFKPTVQGVGYHGCGDVDTHSEAYTKWKNMIQRCYNQKAHDNNYYSDYVDCEVCEEWHNFSNFKLWYESHKYGEKTLHLDKDILFKSNKTYSPENCCLVSKEINNMFIRTKKNDRDLPIGVYRRDNGKYRAEISFMGKNKKLGTFEDVDSAFMAYKEHKEKMIKDIADQHWEKIPYNTCFAMMNWIVEITD